MTNSWTISLFYLQVLFLTIKLLVKEFIRISLILPLIHLRSYFYRPS